jgi:hypothetical protein
MIRFRSGIVVLFAIALLATSAGPVGASAKGVATGVMRFGKVATVCRHDGTSDVSGAGLGLPGMPQTKNAFFRFDTSDPDTPGSLIVIKTGKNNNGSYAGVLKMCGRLGELGRGPTAIGASCGVSKGYHGKGRITFNSGDKTGQIYSLHDITWKISAGGTHEFTASGQDGVIAKGAHGRDMVKGVLQTMPDLTGGQLGFPGCAIKSQNAAAKNAAADMGGRRFSMVATFSIVNGAWVDPQGGNTTPGVCKHDTNPLCLFKSKPPQSAKT